MVEDAFALWTADGPGSVTSELVGQGAPASSTAELMAEQHWQVAGLMAWIASAAPTATGEAVQV